MTTPEAVTLKTVEKGQRVAIVGSTSLEGHPTLADVINLVLDEYRPSVVISGGAYGVDKEAARLARLRGIEVVEHLPKFRNWLLGFKPRNELIAQDCDTLVRIVDEASRSYGSGWTRDRAEALGKATFEVTLFWPVKA